MDDMLEKFKDVLDEEIMAYESLGELYQAKQSILVQGKSDALWDIDSQILAKADVIKEFTAKRKEVAAYLGDENLSMSDIIEKAKNADSLLAQKLEGQRTKLRVLAKSLMLQEDTNLNLVKHGLTMVNKTLDIVVGALLPQIQATQYDKSGKNIAGDKSLISSVVKEV